MNRFPWGGTTIDLFFRESIRQGHRAGEVLAILLRTNVREDRVVEFPVRCRGNLRNMFRVFYLDQLGRLPHNFYIESIHSDGHNMIWAQFLHNVIQHNIAHVHPHVKDYDDIGVNVYAKYLNEAVAVKNSVDPVPELNFKPDNPIGKQSMKLYEATGLFRASSTIKTASEN